MKIIICILIFNLIYSFAVRKYKNPYKLYMVFGKKGSGKSTFLVQRAIYYLKRGWNVYTNMQDLMLDNVRLIEINDLGEFVPEENSVLLLDEAGMIYDNRKFKDFKPETRDFYKLQRHYKVVVYLASQTFDVDKKIRDLTDEMFLISNVATIFSLIRPIRKTVALVESTAEGESRIAENLKFRFFTSWKLQYIPKYSKHFKSFKVPDKQKLKYINLNGFNVNKKRRIIIERNKKATSTD